MVTAKNANSTRKKRLDQVLKVYMEKELIKKMKQNTWNWIVANKIEYVNFMANNFEKFKQFFAHKKGEEKNQDEYGKLHSLLYL